MTVHRIQLPDGSVGRFDAPTPAAAMQQAQGWWAQNNPRALATADAAKTLAARGPAGVLADAAATAFTGGLARQVGAGTDAALTGLGNLVTRATGGKPKFGMADTYAGYLQAAKDAEAAHPVQSGIGGLLGALGTVGLGGGVVKTAAGAAPATVVGRALQLARGSVAGAATGAAQGATQGALTAPVGQQLQAAQRGAVAGGVTGLAVPGVAAGVGAVARPVARAVARTANRLSGGKLLNPTVEAAQRLSAALAKDGVTGEDARSVMNDWLAHGNDAPSLIDATPQGGAVQSLVAGAAMRGGPARTAAQLNLQKVYNNVKPRAVNLAQSLTPDDSRSAADYITQQTAQRGTDAAANYAPVYAADTPITSELTPAILSDAPGKAALAAARANVAERAPLDPAFAQQLSEIDKLASGDFNSPVSGGTMDSIKRAFAERGSQLKIAGNNTQAAGALGRRDVIENELEQVPGFTEARDAFKAASRNIEGAENGQSILSATPDNYAAANPQDGMAGTQIGARQGIVDRLNDRTAGSVNAINELSAGTGDLNVAANLQHAFGDSAMPFQQAMSNEAARVRNAVKTSPMTGSDTARRGLDADDEGLPSIPLHPAGILTAAVNAIKNGATITDGERQAIVNFGTSPVTDDLIRQLAQNPNHWLSNSITYSTPAIAAQAAQQAGP